MPNDVKNISGNLIKQPAEEFQVRSATSSVCFDFNDAPPPSRVYIGLDDQLITSFIGLGTGSGVNVNLRILRPDGKIVPLTLFVKPNNSVTPALSFFPLVEGFLLSLTAQAAGTPITGTPTYIMIGLARAPLTIASVYEVLTAGYLYQSQPFGWPETAPLAPTEGVPWYHSVALGAIGAGAEFVTAISAGLRRRLVSVSATLATSAVAGNRSPSLVIDDGANIVGIFPSGFTQIASLTVEYTWADGIVQSVTNATQIINPTPGNCILTAGFRVRSLTSGILAGDQWSAITFLFGDLLEPL